MAETLANIATPTEAYKPPESMEARLRVLHRALFDALTPQEARYAESRANGSPPYVAARCAGVPANDTDMFLKRAANNPLVAQATRVFDEQLNRAASAVSPSKIQRLLDRAASMATDASELTQVASQLIKLYTVLKKEEVADAPSTKLITAKENIAGASDADLARAAKIDKVDEGSFVEFE